MRWETVLAFAVSALVGAVGASAASQVDELRFETKDWIFVAPSVLGDQADLELNGRAVQICHDEIERLVGRRPRNVRKFTMTWAIDGGQVANAGRRGVTNHVPSAEWRLVDPGSRAFRAQIVAQGRCFGPHEITHVLTWESWGPPWANEGLATFTDRLYEPEWECCSAPIRSTQRCDEDGYTDGLASRAYSDLNPFRIDFQSYSTAACFWFEVHRLGGFPAIRGVLAGMRTRVPRTTGEFVAHANRVLNADLRPIAARYGFEASELAAPPIVLPGCTLIGTAAGDVISGTRGSDTVCGLAGNDRLAGGSGRDILDGGAGADVLNARDGSRDVVRGGPGRDAARIDRGLDRVSGVERLLP